MPTPTGTGINDVGLLPDGTWFALGDTVVQRWTVTSWQTLGPGQLASAHGIAQLPNGDPVIAGPCLEPCPQRVAGWQQLAAARHARHGGTRARVVAADNGGQRRREPGRRMPPREAADPEGDRIVRTRG